MDVRRTAEFTASQLEKAGFPSVEIIETKGHPSIIGEWCDVPDAPTILIYGHYDVQPPDPLEKWNSSPFEPVICDDRLYARGVSDDKGPRDVFSSHIIDFCILVLISRCQIKIYIK